MPRNPSTILSAAEAKVVDLDKEVTELNRAIKKLEKERDKLVVKRDKALAPKKPRAKKQRELPLDGPMSSPIEGDKQV